MSSKTNVRCPKCDHIRQQAERTFAELRHQTDLHISLVEKKLKEQYVAEQAELQTRFNERLGTAESKLGTAESRLKSLELENERLRNLLIEAEQRVKQATSQNQEISSQLNRTHQKLNSAESTKRDWDIEKAKIDLSYRKRIGEMEAEVRRSEIESVRLRNKLLAQSQTIESLTLDISKLRSTTPPFNHDRQSAPEVAPTEPTLSLKKRLFALEEKQNEIPRLGRISKISTATSTPEIPPETPTSVASLN